MFQLALLDGKFRYQSLKRAQGAIRHMCLIEPNGRRVAVGTKIGLEIRRLKGRSYEPDKVCLKGISIKRVLYVKENKLLIQVFGQSSFVYDYEKEVVL